MAGWSLGWGVREMGRRMSGKTRIGGRVAKMSLKFFFDRFSLLLEGGGVCVYSSWDLAVEYICKIHRLPNPFRFITCITVRALYFLSSVRIQRDFES